jgi:hypothetical protein
MGEPFHWSQGNGALPFPGRRVESVTKGPYANMKTYEIREYLGNETVVSYRLIFNVSVPESFIWKEMEHEFRRYVTEGPS